MKEYIVFDLDTFKFFCRISRGLVSTEEFFETMDTFDTFQKEMVNDSLHYYNVLEEDDFNSYDEDYDYEE